eukprot:scaffold90829_cov19-Tisochrysis_lutea.AAC.1
MEDKAYAKVRVKGLGQGSRLRARVKRVMARVKVEGKGALQQWSKLQNFFVGGRHFMDSTSCLLQVQQQQQQQQQHGS